MKISIAICTWNRSSLLRRTLSEMCDLSLPPSLKWELIVVNNNSTDNTDAVIESFKGVLPIHGVKEAEAGQSAARNRAIKEATGDYILWTDDDVLVSRQWLVAYADSILSDPDAAMFGGPILPWFEVNPPYWLNANWDRLSSAYAVRPRLSEKQQITMEEQPFGANYAVRMDVQRSHLYDTRLGLKPKGAIRGEETKVISSLLAEGYRGWWVPEAEVRHFIPKDRLSTGYLKRYYRGQGAAAQMVSPSCCQDVATPMLFGVPRWMWRQLVVSKLSYVLARVRNPADVWIEKLIGHAVLEGRIKYMRREGRADFRRNTGCAVVPQH